MGILKRWMNKGRLFDLPYLFWAVAILIAIPIVSFFIFLIAYFFISHFARNIGFSIFNKFVHFISASFPSIFNIGLSAKK